MWSHLNVIIGPLTRVGISSEENIYGFLHCTFDVNRTCFVMKRQDHNQNFIQNSADVSLISETLNDCWNSCSFVYTQKNIELNWNSYSNCTMSWSVFSLFTWERLIQLYITFHWARLVRGSIYEPERWSFISECDFFVAGLSRHRPPLCDDSSAWSNGESANNVSQLIYIVYANECF